MLFVALQKSNHIAHIYPIGGTEMHWFASLTQVDKKIYCLVRSDFEGNNIFNFISDDQEGIDWIDTMIHNIISSGQRITFGIDYLATPFIKGEQKKVWQHLVQTYGSQLYELTRENNMVAYIPKTKIDFCPSTKQHCSVLLLERNVPIALFCYLHNAEPPFHPIDVASFSCSIIAHCGLSRLLCSRGMPPSSQDIEVFLREGKDGTPFTLIFTDIIYAIQRTPDTPTDYDREEFYLSYAEMIAKFKKYGANLAHKIAVLETCRRYKLGLACSSLYAEDKRTLNGNFRLVGPEDYIIPLSIKVMK